MEPMEYRISRDGKTFGPYTEAELHAYFAAGNIVETDLVRSADTDKWATLKKHFKEQEKQKKKAPLLLPGLRGDLPAPPDMPWWLAMILEVFTGFAFFIAWDIVEGFWLHRVMPRSRALWYFIAAALLFAVNAPAIYSTVLHNVFNAPITASTNATWIGVASFALRIVARFSMRSSLLQHFNETEPIGLKLSWWMTLLFGGLYFQYHFNRVNDGKRLLAITAI
jgi:hypothetical protein